MLCTSPLAVAATAAVSALLVLSAAARASPAPFRSAPPHKTLPQVIAEYPRVGWLAGAVRKAIDAVEINSCGSEDKHPCGGRDFSNAAVAVYLLSGGRNASGAMHWLSKVQPGASFVGQGFCALAHESSFMNNLNASSRAWVLESINRALPGLSQWNGTDVSYSNMFFMGYVNCIICGGVPGVNETAGALATAHGYKLLDYWLSYASEAGNHEFASPTYYWVQINALTLGCMYAQDSEGRASLCAVLEHLWADVAANFFSPTETMSGAHSRDYDFLAGHGALQVHTYVNGLGTHYPVCELHDAHCERTNDGQNALTLLNAWHARDDSGVGYMPYAETLALSQIPHREIRGRWIGQNRTANNESVVRGDRYNYIVSGLYAMGSASLDYITNTHTAYYPSPQDKLLAIDMASPGMSQERPLVTISLVPDWLDSPWGHNWTGNPTDKPSHLASHPGNVQLRNLLLATSALNPTEKLDGFQVQGFSSLASNVILPAACSSFMVSGDQSVSPCPISPFERELEIDDVVGIRVNRSCFATRILAVDGASGSGPTISLKADPAGLELGAFRLAAYHYRGPKSNLTQSTHVRSAFLMVVDECQGETPLSESGADAGLLELVRELHTAKIEQQTSGGIWSVSASMRGHTLLVGRDVSEPHCKRWSCVVQRRIDGEPVTPVRALEVNGKVIAPLPDPHRHAQSCIPFSCNTTCSDTKRCCESAGTCRFDPVFQDKRCIPPPPELCS